MGMDIDMSMREKHQGLVPLQAGFTLIELLACQPTCPTKPWRSREPWRRQARQGFTLIELLVVIAIIGLLFAVAMPMFESMGRKDTDRAAYQLMTTLRLARQNAIARRQWTMVVFPTRDGTYSSTPGAVDSIDKCLRSYAVLAATNNLDGQYRFAANLRDPRISDMELTFVSDWKYLPEGIYFDDDTDLSSNFLFGGEGANSGSFRFPLDPANPNNLVMPMGVILFKPNGRAFVTFDSSTTGKFFQDRDYGRIYIASDKYYQPGATTLQDPVPVPGTNTVMQIRNKTGQIVILDVGE